MGEDRDRMDNSAQAWQSRKLTETYLQGVRGAIPFAGEQIDVMLRVIGAARPDAGLVLDLGCGDGILAQAILDRFPAAQLVLLDFSEPMLEMAKERLLGYDSAAFGLVDYSDPSWLKDAYGENAQRPGYDVIVSGFSIHHQPDSRKRQLYQELYDLLKPGGLFLNLEHVASSSAWGESLFADYFIDALYDYQQRQGAELSREEVDRRYYSRPDKAANILAPVETQCQWLREIGFERVDCFLKIFELALFGGVKGA